jgi:hypothetical protein
MIESTIDKLLFREYNRIDELRKRLTEEVAEFEKKYAMDSDNFYRRYESGSLGDDTDFIEWSATIDMLNNVRQQLYLLKTAGDEPTYHYGLRQPLFRAFQQSVISSNPVL